MRQLMCVLLLSVFAAAQTTYISTVQGVDGVLTMTNTSPQSIILAVGQIKLDGRATGPYVHEAFFGTMGWTPGMTESFDGRDPQVTTAVPNYSIEFTYLQFDDGSSWGDKTAPAVRDALSRRAARLKYLQNLVQQAGNSPDSFQKALIAPLSSTAPELSMQRKYVGIIGTDGLSAAIDNARKSLARTMVRVNSGKF